MLRLTFPFPLTPLPASLLSLGKWAEVGEEEEDEDEEEEEEEEDDDDDEVEVVVVVVVVPLASRHIVLTMSTTTAVL